MLAALNAAAAGCSAVLGLVNLILPIKEFNGNLPVVGAVILGKEDS